MKDLLSSLLGVPGAILIAAGLGIVGVTLYSRLRPAEGRDPIRWAHLVFGVALSAVGILVIEADVALFGTH